MSIQAQVIGVGMTPFRKPGSQEPYRVMAAKAIKAACMDAGVDYGQVQQAFASYIYGDSCCGQHAVYDVGMSGIPVFNVNNNCSSGSSAIMLARQAVESGQVECALVVGFEEMQRGALASHWDDREAAFERIDIALTEKFDAQMGPMALRSFGSAGREYLDRYNVSSEVFAKVAVKSRTHAANNSLALFKAPITVDEVLNADIVYSDYLTKLMACPPTCGAAAAIISSESFARKIGNSRAINILSQAIATDTDTTWDDPINLAGADMTRRAARLVYEQAGIGPEAVDVVELHDCFVTNEVITYEGLGLCGEGEATQFVNNGDNTYGGKFVVNPSGGLMSKGHPIGATGVAQCAELTWQLRGEAGKRQVEGAQIALQHNLGLGGAVAVTMYQKAH